MTRLVILFFILPQHQGQKPAEWPWSEATVRYTSALGSYPRDHCPNLATVVLPDSEVYRPSEWGWDLKDWTRILKGTIGEKIKVGCRKGEGSLYEKASAIAIAGNSLKPDGKNDLHPTITAKLCPTTEWECDKQSPFILCCCQKNVSNYTLDPSANNVEITKLCRNKLTDCWYSFPLTKPTYVTCNWQNNLADQPSLKGLTYKLKINAVAKPILSAVITYHGISTPLVLDDKNKAFPPPFMVTQGDDVTIRCGLITEFFLLNPYTVIALDLTAVFCEIQNQDCWLNLIAVQFSHEVMCGKNNTKYWGELKVDVAIPTTQPPVMLSPRIFEIGPCIITKTGQQQILFNPAWSLKQVKLLMQNNVPEIQPVHLFCKLPSRGGQPGCKSGTLLRNERKET